MLYHIATGTTLDPDRTTRFADLVDRIYADPFKKKQPETPEEIKAHIVGKIRELRGG